MKFSVVSDANVETRTRRVSSELVRKEDLFTEKDYGSGIALMGLVLMCRHPELQFQQRVTYKKKSELYIDVMLNYDKMVNASNVERMDYVADEIRSQVAKVLWGRAFPNFDRERFVKDLDAWLADIVASYDGHGSGSWKY